MNGTLNKVQIIGNLGEEPNIRTTKDGSQIAKLSVATNHTVFDKATGELKEATEWHQVAIFADAFIEKVVKKYLRKGTKIYVEGYNRTDRYTDKNGVERFSTEVIMRELTILDNVLSQPETEETVTTH